MTHHQTRKTHCPNNHPYTPDNTYIDPRGYRNCLLCQVLTRSRSRTTGSRTDGDGART